MRAHLLATALAALVAIALLPRLAAAQGAASPAYKADVIKLAAWIDDYLDGQWKKHDIKPAPLADDAIFFRRLSLDLMGRIPEVTNVQDFIDPTNKDPDKHWKWTDKYLNTTLSSRHFASFWRTVIIGRSTNQQFQFFYPQFEAWLEDKLAKNTPLDEITKQILTVQNNQPQFQPGFGGAMQGNLSPIAFVGVNEGKPENIAGAAARVFLGVKIECAQCHKHPFAKWTRDQFWEFAAFFSGPNPFAQPMPPMKGVKPPSFTPGREIVIPEVNKVVKAKYLNGEEPNWGAFSDSRKTLAAWMTSPENPYFARAMADHLWAYFFGVSLLEPILEPNDDSPVTHPELLDRLAKELIDHKFDPKYLIRAVAMTKAYQRSSGGPELATKEDYHLFLRMPIRSLTPEQIYDSIAEATRLETNVQPYDPRFVNQFGQPNTPRGQFLQRFGTQDRRYDPQTSILQALFMMNGKFLTERTKADHNPDISTLATQPGPNAKKLRSMFWLVLSRPPRADEVDRLLPYLDKGGPSGNHQRAIEDIYWVLLNSPEFVLNH